MAGRDLHGELKNRVVLEGRVGRAAAGGETGDPLGSTGVKKAQNWCKAGVKRGGAPGDAVAVHLAEHAGVAHVHLRLGARVKLLRKHGV